MFWSTHTANLDQLVYEVNQYEKQSQTSLAFLLDQYNKARSEHDSEVLCVDLDPGDMEGRASGGAIQARGVLSRRPGPLDD